jgi:hypothetical protein
MKLAELPITPPEKTCTRGKVLAVFVDAMPPMTFAGGSRTPPPKIPGVTLPAATLPAPPVTVPLTFPFNVPLKYGAVTPPALTIMLDDVARLAWLGPLAVNVPDEAWRLLVVMRG